MDFRAFSIEKSSSMRFHFVSSGDFTSYDQSRLNPVRGTMQIHQIVGIVLATTNRNRETPLVFAAAASVLVNPSLGARDGQAIA
jgi:hypothetical protein